MKQAQAIQETPDRAKRLWLAFILGTLSAFGPFSLDMYLPALTLLAEDLNTTASYAQLSLTACMIGLALGQLVVGPISDARGRRGPLLIGLGLFSVSSILCFLAPSIEMFVVMRFIQGAAGAAGIVISRAVVRDLYSGTEMTKFFSLLMLINGAAPIIAPIAGGQLLTVTSWRGVFVVLTVIGVLSLIGVIFGLSESLAKEKRTTGGLKQTFQAFSTIMRNRVFMGYALVQGFVSAAMFAYISGSPFVLQKIYEVTPQTYSLIFAMNGAGIIIASQLAGRLAERFGETRLLVIGLTIAGIGGVSLLLAVLAEAPLVGILIPLFLVVSCVGIVNTASFGLAMQNQQNSAGSASALLGVLTFLFGGLVAPLVGIGGEDTALPMGIVIAAADVLAVVIYIVMIGSRSKKSA